ncbi:Glucose-1-phosphate thymidylyltransferase [Anaerohalosphaera lusitana]|uniref:glucose-1-phosphate thymidylyltransferase n=1 Tax=Anaerohalosphaera lusitana TaxID=1936003 RepID=A0A1U9NNA6_9BACT|nr:sugar phosphate nucleotidyltransferase [Anaerohalosphaera lusitana]AQT69432.1 Glucose-1-phosphate thymidylyltransferase [Anaerohalosphaera lusitana]
MELKGVILAGGLGTRLHPLTKVTNKHLLPVGRKPMIYYPIEKLTAAGVTEILVVTGLEHMGDVVNLLGSGREFNCKFTYKVQDEAGGIAQALGLAENFAAGSSVAVILGDNIFQADLKPYADAFRKQSEGAKLLLKEVADPERFGVAQVDGDRIVGIEEKPAQPKSNLIVTGVYFYDHRVYEYIKTLKPSGRGEFEITDVNNIYIQKEQLKFEQLSGWWSDAGTFRSLNKVNELVAKEPPQ